MYTAITKKINNPLRDDVKKISLSAVPTKRNLALWEQTSRNMDKDKKSSKSFSKVSMLIEHLKLQKNRAKYTQHSEQG